MRSIAEMLKPRESVFSDTVRDDVLNLSDFAEGNIDAHKFFSENFKTQGMTMLFDTAFKRFKGESDTGVVKLTQAMGGGKTHSMLALALLADNVDLRAEILGDDYKALGKINVVTFSGRENADFGIWGSIAEQLGKKEMFSGYYSPLKAPGESAWINLLQGDKTLILLDELPPYLENARSITVGNSDLSKVTIAALANLFSALGKAQLANVCLVFSDLRAAYESGSDLLQSSFKELEQEANRIAIEVAPVSLNSDEIYYILKKRLFEDQPLVENYAMEKNEVAIGFKDAVEASKKMGFTSYTGEAVYRGINDSYPFHPSIRDLYARFKENQNFQQTRGLIKLMRQIVREFYESGRAKEAYIINVFDVNLNNPNLLSLFRQINPSLEEAISHDIAQDKQAIAEIIDEESQDKSNNAQQLAKLLLVSSLSTASHALLGLTEAEALGFMSAPGADMNVMKSALESLRTQCWYIKADNRGRLYFQNTKNMVAEMNTLVDSYTNENAKKELRQILKDNFAPKMKDCYELLYVLPAVDEISLDTKKISLVIFEPYPGNTLHPDLANYYNNSSLKNRVMFLSGERSIMEKLYANSKKLKAIQTIVQNMDDEGLPANDQQRKEADVQLDKATQALLSTIRETFVTLYYPSKNGIVSTEFKLEFKDNKFDGEEQIKKTLADEMKYEAFSKEDGFMETLRKKCEARLFTTSEMTYNQIVDRAATEAVWGWYHPDQLDSLKAYCLKTDKWRELGGYLQKGPFEKEPTSVQVSQTSYNEDTEEFTLSVRGIGGRVYYDIGADPTSASSELTDQVLVTTEPELRFACIDPSGERKTGDIKEFLGEPSLKYGERSTPSGRYFEIRTNKKYEIRFTTDGSEPKENGGIYTEEILVPDECRFVRIALMYAEKLITTKDVPISKDSAQAEEKKIDEDQPLVFKYKSKKKCDDTESSYRNLENLAKIDGLTMSGVSAFIFEKENQANYVEIQSGVQYKPDTFKAMIDLVRETSFEGKDITVTIDYKELRFDEGRKFNTWVELCKQDLNTLNKEGTINQ
ncbi:DUF499 domain-containing protein [Butyrivibrio sp. VCB2006]|uniref:DUF499 domain-containing protein n=1 Tax=Butyrivibrio sp. VCB2006 TaxID=1280679 RepID=UPI000411126C|nr:DUF499 domain-containing protein [Butyrivibrio sp. VCB2006]